MYTQFINRLACLRKIRRVIVDARVNYSGNLMLCDNLADSIGIHLSKE